ncbi:Uu.00g040760.m01.CDS01 [Anthostomella pinea]|uniref:Uu.00g040760.m01.CDS01 n=1 Tax=Anthostomella pinea TaxID=933095 RepID=A0AAI8VAD6_9PEZI|nr:Uu.00g040760.m01.CDS01 [Anthostomella pinea]
MSFPDPSQPEFGQSIPPHGPHAITTQGHGWEIMTRFRDGDLSLVSQMKSMYPRFGPFGHSSAATRAHATSAHRKDKDRLEANELRYHAVDIHGVRLYLVVFPMAKMMGALFMWQHAGLGFSTRFAESLLPHVDALTHLGEFSLGGSPPPPTYLPEGESHALLRKRIAGLMMRACVREYERPVVEDDVFLYQTGMAAITRFHHAVTTTRSGPVVVFGAVFHSTYHLFEESAGGVKHYGKCDGAEVDDFEKYLEGGGECSYVFTEFPSNPIMVCVNLMRLRKLADKHGFLLAADDTCASFCNIDLLPAADAVITSLTKSFSGYADVMAGSVVVNPNTPQRATLKHTLASRFHNQLFDGDAAHLLKNSDDYLPRSRIHNRNAAALAAYFAELAADPAVPVSRVWYPPHSPGSDTYLAAFRRKATPDFPAPGYGCLLSVEFDTVDCAIAFYDGLNFYQGPHLGAHLSIALAYTAMAYGKDNSEYHASYGLRPQQIRLSVGLEDEALLLRRCEEAVAKMVVKMGKKGDGEALAAEVERRVADDGDVKTGFDPIGGTGA